MIWFVLISFFIFLYIFIELRIVIGLIFVIINLFLYGVWGFIILGEVIILKIGFSIFFNRGCIIIFYY